MPKSPSALPIWGLAAVAAAALLVGCSSSEPKISKGEVEDTVAEKLAAQMNQPKPDIACPEDLAGEVGTTMRCELTATDGSTIGLTVKVTSVEDDTVKYDIEVDESAS
ncbi:DUF4333 domain-containing protein [Streptomyces sp. CRN 30]|uniref:DUF4333 domain-containing protein n=1 Tax=Streptomyces sp. CRN 30 TaxID=3075613 RepID=UPI002A7EE087|nr:DUF4333 domain-containing protein [Streptomyces sp. CRN 30]